MGEKTDQIKGKAKEQAGRATDDESLKREGETDQAEGKLKRRVPARSRRVSARPSRSVVNSACCLRLVIAGQSTRRMEAIGNGAGSQVLLVDGFRTKAARRRKR